MMRITLKNLFCYVTFCSWLTSAIHISAAPPPLVDTNFSIVSINGNSRIWRNASGGQYVEIATAMNYFDAATQQWVKSAPSFTPASDGSAFLAQKLESQITLSVQLNTASAVQVVTADNITLQSTPVAIGLYDRASGKSVIIASLTNSTGELIDPQHVIYPAALVGDQLSADVCYSLPDCSAFHQDVVITKWNGPLDPTIWGLPASATNTLELQILTEFYGNMPAPTTAIMHPLYVEANPTVRANMVTPDIVDYTYAFGQNYMFAPGSAYTAATNAPASTNGPGSLPGHPGNAPHVAKSFITSGQPARTFLVESIPYAWLEGNLQALPAMRTSTRANLQKSRTGRKSHEPMLHWGECELSGPRIISPPHFRSRRRRPLWPVTKL